MVLRVRHRSTLKPTIKNIFDTFEFRTIGIEELYLIDIWSLGIKLDAEANAARAVEVVISTPDSPIKVIVVPTNEELVIARDTRDIVGK